MYAGIAYLFSKFDWKEYEDHDKNSDYVRQYPCPVLGCNFTAFRPNAIYKHINSKQHNTSELPQAAQHVIYQGKEIHSLRVIIRADGEPDYIPCKPRTDSVTAAHKAHDSVEEEELKQNGGGSSSKRHRKQTEPYRPAAAQLKQHKKATAAQAAKAAATAADNNIQMEFLCEAKEAYGRAMETNKKMYDMQLAHAEALNKQAAAHTEELHSMAIAAAERNTDTKVLEAKLASERRVTMLYNKTCIPLLNAANNLAAVAPVGHAANPNMDGYLET